jgi:hypothetical protein
VNSRSASFCVGLTGTTRCGWMPSVASTLLVLSQRSCTPLITYACTLCTCAPACFVALKPNLCFRSPLKEWLASSAKCQARWLSAHLDAVHAAVGAQGGEHYQGAAQAQEPAHAPCSTRDVRLPFICCARSCLSDRQTALKTPLVQRFHDSLRPLHRTVARSRYWALACVAKSRRRAACREGATKVSSRGIIYTKMTDQRHGLARLR